MAFLSHGSAASQASHELLCRLPRARNQDHRMPRPRTGNRTISRHRLNSTVSNPIPRSNRFNRARCSPWRSSYKQALTHRNHYPKPQPLPHHLVLGTHLLLLSTARLPTKQCCGVTSRLLREGRPPDSTGFIGNTRNLPFSVRSFYLLPG